MLWYGRWYCCQQNEYFVFVFNFCLILPGDREKVVRLFVGFPFFSVNNCLTVCPSSCCFMGKRFRFQLRGVYFSVYFKIIFFPFFLEFICPPPSACRFLVLSCCSHSIGCWLLLVSACMFFSEFIFLFPFYLLFVWFVLLLLFSNITSKLLKCQFEFMFICHDVILSRGCCCFFYYFPY